VDRKRLMWTKCVQRWTNFYIRWTKSYLWFIIIRDRIQSWSISQLECLHCHVIIYVITNTLLHEPNNGTGVFAGNAGNISFSAGAGRNWGMTRNSTPIKNFINIYTRLFNQKGKGCWHVVVQLLLGFMAEERSIFQPSSFCCTCVPWFECVCGLPFAPLEDT